MGRLDHGSDRDRAQSDFDLQTWTQVQMADDLHAIREGRGNRRHRSGGGNASSGLHGRGWVFWVMLIVMTCWFLIPKSVLGPLLELLEVMIGVKPPY